MSIKEMDQKLINSYQVIAIQMSPKDSQDLHHIVKLRLRDPNGKEDNYLREKVADAINKNVRIYVLSDAKVIPVKVFPLNGKLFIRTIPNATGKDNLLNLPRF